MNSNQVIAASLLIGRLFTVYYMIRVIKRQAGFLKANKHKELQPLRRNLFIGSLVVVLGNIFPIVIDTAGIFGKGSFTLLLLYVYSNNITAIIGAYILWANIKLTEKIRLADLNDSDN